MIYNRLTKESLRKSSFFKKQIFDFGKRIVTYSRPMAQKWYEKTTVQSALIGGGSACIVVIISLKFFIMILRMILNQHKLCCRIRLPWRRGNLYIR